MLLVEGGGYLFPCGIFTDRMVSLMHAKIWLRTQPDQDHTVSVVRVPVDRDFPMGPANRMCIGTHSTDMN